MRAQYVRTVEERLADPTWTRPKNWLLLIPVLSLGTLTFVWFWLRANLDPEDRARFEVWAWVWGMVALAGGTLGGGGVLFGTPDEMAVSTVIWIMRVTSVVHAWTMNRNRLERMARRELGAEVTMIAMAQSRGSRPAFGGATSSRFPTSGRPTAEPPPGFDPRLAATFPQAYTGQDEPAPTAGVPQAPERPVRAAPPVDPASAGRVLEPPPVQTRFTPAPDGSPFDGIPDVEPEPERWMPDRPARPGEPRRPAPGRRLDL